MDDLISRAAAQTELQLSARRYTVAHEAHGEGQVVWSESLISVSDAMNVLRKLPSAQPEPCEDAVSRNLVLTEVKSGMIRTIDGENWKRVSDNVRDIKVIPSVTPKQRTGKWIKTARWRNVYKCDQCGNYLDFSGVNAGRGDANFCPNCGADMREVNHESN